MMRSRRRGGIISEVGSFETFFQHAAEAPEFKSGGVIPIKIRLRLFSELPFSE